MKKLSGTHNKSRVRLFMVTYGLVIYQVNDYWARHKYPNAPTIGLSSSTTISEQGMFLFAVKRLPLEV